MKVADVAMCNPEYEEDYSEIGGRPAAPVRWLPWESILLVSSGTFHRGVVRLTLLQPKRNISL